MPNPLGMTLAMRPSVPDPSKPTVAPVNVGQIYQNSYADQMANYQANLAKQNAMWGGLASIGGTLAGLPMGGGASLGGKLVGNLFPSLGGASAPGTVGTTYAGGIPPESSASSLAPTSALNTSGTFGAVPTGTSFLDAGSAAAPVADAGLGLGADTAVADAGLGLGADTAVAGGADAAAAGAAAGGVDLASLLPFLLLA